MNRLDFLEHLRNEGCEISPDLSDDDCDVVLHYLYNSRFKAIPRDIEWLDAITIVNTCDELGVRVPERFEDWRELYISFRNALP